MLKELLMKEASQKFSSTLKGLKNVDYQFPNTIRRPESFSYNSHQKEDIEGVPWLKNFGES